jgi:hypothetical protein
MASAEARLAWLLDVVEIWIIRTEAEKHAMSECSERIRLDGELVALRVLYALIVSGREEI